MMKFVMAAVLTLASAQSAFAQEAINFENVQVTDTSARDVAAGVIIGAAIGGLIGAIAADQWDGQHRRRSHFVCYARNLRGQVFRANGFGARNVQSKALNKCLRVSAQCRPLGCQR